MTSDEKTMNGAPRPFLRFRVLWQGFNRCLSITMALWLLITVFHITFDIFCRYAFNAPFAGTLTIAIMMLMFLVYLGAAYCEMVGGHIRVDMLHRLFPKRWQKRFDVIWLLGALSILPLLCWQTFKLAMDSYRAGETATDIALPLYPGKFVISIGFCLWTIQIIVALIERYYGITQPGKKEAH